MARESAGVTYTLSAFKRARFVGGGKPLVLRADQDTAIAMDALKNAAARAWEVLYPLEGKGLAYVTFGATVPTPQGPMLQVIDCEPAKALPLMLESLAAELTALGITGQLTPVKTVREADMFGGAEVPVLGMAFAPLEDTEAMFATYEDWRDAPGLRGCWVPPERLNLVVHTLAEWVTAVEGTLIVHSSAASIEMDPAGLVDYVTQHLRAPSVLRVSAISPDQRRRRQIVFCDAEVLVYDYDPDHPRTDQLASLTDLFTRLAPHLAYGLIRELTTKTNSIIFCNRVPPTIKIFDDLKHTFIVKHLEPHYVFDAGIAQVLTGSQLAKTTLPDSRWTITDLGHDRHLVTSLQPEAWLHPDPHLTYHPFRDPPPSDWTETPSHAAAIAAARADFGPAILTLDTLRQHPPPLTPDQIRTDPTLRQFGVRPPEDIEPTDP